MAMYGIRDRSPFVSNNQSLTATKQGTNRLDKNLKRYYSSIDAEIYFGSYYVDEVVSIAFQVTQNTMPLFGYNAYVYDEMALGSRIVQGQFTINFTRPGYMYDLMNELMKENLMSEESTTTKDPDGMEEQEDVALDMDYKSIKRENRPLFYTGFDIDLMLGQEDSFNSAKHVVLEGVYLTNSSIGMDAQGMPVTETYNFIAKDILPID